MVYIFALGFLALLAAAAVMMFKKPETSVLDRLDAYRAGRDWDAEAEVEERENKENQAAEIARKAAKEINRLAPISASEAKKLEKKLMHAGYRSANSTMIFYAIKLVSLVGFPLLVVLVIMFIGKPLGDSLIYLGGGVLLGFLLPDKILNFMVNSRHTRLRKGLADALDLLVVSVEAGLGLNAALTRVSEEMKTVHPDIADEFGLVNTEIRMGRQREEALRNLADRCGIDDLRSLCAMLIQTDRFGTSIARAIRVYAEALRTKRRQRAEQAAQRAAVKMLFPLAVFLFPTLFIVLLGPAALQMVENLK
ncbi:MAG: type II secretion system F family protein [Acidobacteria bacterium]|nr:type II secretion system F family protein [Acidobacteriota bacterium]